MRFAPTLATLPTPVELLADFTSLIVPKSHTHMSRGPSPNSRGVGVRVNPGGNTKESIALPASFYYAHRLGVARLQSRMHQDPGVKVGTSYLYHAWGLFQPHRATFWFYLTPGHLQGRAQTSYIQHAGTQVGTKRYPLAARTLCTKGKDYRLAHALSLVISRAYRDSAQYPVMLPSCQSHLGLPWHSRMVLKPPTH